MNSKLSLDDRQIARLCQKYHIVELKLFGSALTSEFNQESDIDLLVRFSPGKTPGWEVVEIEQAFSDLFKRPVDLITEASLRPRWREVVLPDAEVLYAA